MRKLISILILLILLASNVYAPIEKDPEGNTLITDSRGNTVYKVPSNMEATENQDIQRDINHLTKELMKGNLQAGLSYPRHVGGTNIFYLRSRKGGRLFYRQIGPNQYEIVAKAAGTGTKANEDAVIIRLQQIYGS